MRQLAMTQAQMVTATTPTTPAPIPTIYGICSLNTYPLMHAHPCNISQAYVAGIFP